MAFGSFQGWKRSSEDESNPLKRTQEQCHSDLELKGLTNRLKVRVVHSVFGNIKAKNGDSQLLSLALLDKNNNFMRGSCFGKTRIRNLQSELTTVNGIYYLDRALVQHAQSEYTWIRNIHELQLVDDCTFTSLPADPTFPEIFWNVVRLEDFYSGLLVDVVYDLVGFYHQKYTVDAVGGSSEVMISIINHRQFQVDINITKFGGQLPSLNTVIQFKGVERVQQAGGAIGRAYFDTIIETGSVSLLEVQLLDQWMNCSDVPNASVPLAEDSVYPDVIEPSVSASGDLALKQAILDGGNEDSSDNVKGLPMTPPVTPIKN